MMKNKSRWLVVISVILVVVILTTMLVSCQKKDDEKTPEQSQTQNNIGNIFEGVDLTSSKDVNNAILNKVKETNNFTLRNEFRRNGVLQEYSITEITENSFYTRTESDNKREEYLAILDGEKYTIYLKDEDGWKFDVCNNGKQIFKTFQEQYLNNLVDEMESLDNSYILYDKEKDAFSLGEMGEYSIKGNGIEWKDEIKKYGEVYGLETRAVANVSTTSQRTPIENAVEAKLVVDEPSNVFLTFTPIVTKTEQLSDFYKDIDKTIYANMYNKIYETIQLGNLTYRNYINGQNIILTKDKVINQIKEDITYRAYDTEKIIAFKESAHKTIEKDTLSYTIGPEDKIDEVFKLNETSPLLSTVLMSVRNLDNVLYEYDTDTDSFKYENTSDKYEVKFVLGGLEYRRNGNLQFEIKNIGVTECNNIPTEEIKAQQVFKDANIETILNQALNILKNGDNFTYQHITGQTENVYVANNAFGNNKQIEAVGDGKFKVIRDYGYEYDSLKAQYDKDQDRLNYLEEGIKFIEDIMNLEFKETISDNVRTYTCEEQEVMVVINDDSSIIIADSNRDIVIKNIGTTLNKVFKANIDD